MKISFFAIGILSLMGVAVSSFAAPQIELNIVVEKDLVVEVQPQNKKEEKAFAKLKKAGKPLPTETKRVVADEAFPGEVLLYTINYSNTGDESAQAVQLDNPIAEGTSYVAKSVWGENAEIRFSIDGGKSFFLPAKLTYETKGMSGEVEQRIAEPEKYNAIRWILKEIPASFKGQVGFSVKVN